MSQQKPYKITKREWDELNNFFVTIQPPAQNELFASGDHYILYLMLRKMGFKPPADAMEIYRMAEEILAEGYDE
jgi:hypothetical protein